MGLLGTVVGMIDVFAALMIHGAGDASVLAGGIGQALVTTAVDGSRDSGIDCSSIATTSSSILLA